MQRKKLWHIATTMVELHLHYLHDLREHELNRSEDDADPSDVEFSERAAQIVAKRPGRAEFSAAGMVALQADLRRALFVLSSCCCMIAYFLYRRLTSKSSDSENLPGSPSTAKME